jgi:transcription elongation GreA/GreB family factor
MTNMIQKEEILATCKTLVSQRIQHAEKAMKEAQEGSNSEEKSSAGDKYETARAMGQLARDMNAKQLVQARQELAELNKIDLHESKTVKPGSLVTTNTAIYFIAVGLGPVKMGEFTIIVLSPKSPLALELLGKTLNYSFVFNKKTIHIQSIH